MLFNLAHVLTVSEYEKAKQELLGMSDDAFDDYCHAIEAMAKTDIPVKDFVHKIQDTQQGRGITAENCALTNMPVKLLCDSDNQTVLSEIQKSSPSDHICVDMAEAGKLRKLWDPDLTFNASAPSDLFFAGTIPIRDLDLTIDLGENQKAYCRVVVNENYQEDLIDSDIAYVANLVLYDKKKKMIVPIAVFKGVDFITMAEGVGYVNYPAVERVTENITVKVLSDFTYEIMRIWYSIQIALLHPTIKDIILTGRRVKERIPKEEQDKSRKRIVRYVRHRVINRKSLEEAVSVEPGNYSRHTLVWHVLGHWRICKSGKKVFVRPHWKGPLRAIKKNLDDCERQIVLPEGGSI